MAKIHMIFTIQQVCYQISPIVEPILWQARAIAPCMVSQSDHHDEVVGEREEGVKNFLKKEVFME
ncbi:hypothetical protein BIY37_01785 [Candidatus Brocadia sapporoensis]|uniref:Uncharacterized protein n=1 Tax=Candidatus Brocadia sapporoensis TaxID=392547 RepID=A0A1V6M2S6_9BACT|nr:hypothetical protein BIY37_01785 [Candidatus Brocadia sapporoensis]